MQQLRDHATLTVDDNSFEWLEDFHDRAGTDDFKIKWLSTVNMTQLTEDLGKHGARTPDKGVGLHAVLGGPRARTARGTTR